MDLNKGVPTLFATRVRALGWPLLGFFRDFADFVEGGLWGKSLIGNI